MRTFFQTISDDGVTVSSQEEVNPADLAAVEDWALVASQYQAATGQTITQTQARKWACRIYLAVIAQIKEVEDQT